MCINVIKYKEKFPWLDLNGTKIVTECSNKKITSSTDVDVKEEHCFKM